MHLRNPRPELLVISERSDISISIGCPLAQAPPCLSKCPDLVEVFRLAER
jgi:hypothetical protein